MLSKKAQYAFKALMYMADKKDNEPILIAEISKKEADSPQVSGKHIVGTEKSRRS